jgi:hypothetical protein
MGKENPLILRGARQWRLPKMHDALIEGLEAMLRDLEEGINEADKLIRSNSNEALRRKNEVKLCFAWDLLKGAFSRNPTRVELSFITGISEKSVDHIVMSKTFKDYMKSSKKGKLEDYKHVTYKGIPILIKKRRGRPKYHVKGEKRGRPSIVYTEDNKKLPPALAFWDEIFSHAGKNPDIQKAIERLEHALKQENKQKLSWIAWDAMDETYLHQVTGALAHRLFEIYALQSAGRVYSYLHSEIDSIYEKLIDIVKKNAECLKRVINSKELKDIEKIANEMKKSTIWVKNVAKFSELAKQGESHVVASAFKMWVNNYRLMHIGSQIDKILWEAYEENREVEDLAGSIFNMIDEQVRGAIAAFLSKREKDQSSREF